MRLVPRLAIVVSVLGGAAAASTGCSSTTSGGGGGNPTLDSALEQIAQPICARLQACDAAGFATAFPNGVADCVAQSKASGVQDAQSKGRTTTAAANCSNSDLQACVAAIHAQDCSVFPSTASPTTQYVLPAICNGKC